MQLFLAPNHLLMDVCIDREASDPFVLEPEHRPLQRKAPPT